MVAQSGLDAAAHRLRAFGEEELRDQLEILRSALEVEAQPVSGPYPGARPARDEPIAGDRFLREARVISDLLHRKAIFGEDGSATWIAPGHLQPAGRRRLGRRRLGRRKPGSPYY